MIIKVICTIILYYWNDGKKVLLCNYILYSQILTKPFRKVFLNYQTNPKFLNNYIRLIKNINVGKIVIPYDNDPNWSPSVYSFSCNPAHLGMRIGSNSQTDANGPSACRVPLALRTQIAGRMEHSSVEGARRRAALGDSAKTISEHDVAFAISLWCLWRYREHACNSEP